MLVDPQGGLHIANFATHRVRKPGIETLNRLNVGHAQVRTDPNLDASIKELLDSIKAILVSLDTGKLSRKVSLDS